MLVLNSLIYFYFPFRPHVFGVVALLFLWRCVAFVFCMLSPSDLLWPPSAREHSADPSGKRCTLDSPCNPFPASPFFTVPDHQGCTILAKMTFLVGCAALELCPSHPVHQVSLATINMFWFRSSQLCGGAFMLTGLPRITLSLKWNGPAIRKWEKKYCVWVWIQTCPSQFVATLFCFKLC